MNRRLRTQAKSTKDSWYSNDHGLLVFGASNWRIYDDTKFVWDRRGYPSHHYDGTLHIGIYRCVSLRGFDTQYIYSKWRYHQRKDCRKRMA